MIDLLLAVATGFGGLLAAFTLLWLVSLAKRDVSIVDIAWGPAFALLAWIYHLFGPRPSAARQVLLLALVTVWALRLGVYIWMRGRGEGEDRRYAKMRRKRGKAFRWQSLLTVFWLQAGLATLISLPFLFGLGQGVSRGWRWTDFLGLGLWLVGFFFEAVGDAQMMRFKADPANRGKVLSSGLWAYTRHPNYFGDALLWWGYYVIAIGSPGGFWTFPAPLLMTFFLLKVSGVALLEKDISERRPEYRDYIERTNAFIPGPPKGKTAE